MSGRIAPPAVPVDVLDLSLGAVVVFLAVAHVRHVVAHGLQPALQLLLVHALKPV